MEKKETKKSSCVTFDDAESGEIIYMYGDPAKCFVVDTKLSTSILLHEKGHDPIVGRIGLVKSEFEGRWLRQPRNYMNFAVREDDPIPKMSNEQYTKVVLKRIKQVATMSFGEHVVENMDLRMLRDEYTNNVLFSLRTSVMAETLSDREKTVTFKYPSSWWEWLKLSKAPQWFLKRYPVQYSKIKQKVRFEEMALYPMLPSVMQDYSSEVYFQSMWHPDFSDEKDEHSDITVSIS